MPITKFPQNRMTRAALLLATLGTLVALAYLGGSLLGATPSVSAHLASKSDDNGPLLMRAPLGIPFPVTVYSSGSTHEHRDDSVMVTDVHRNFVNLPNGKCGKATDLYPTCFALAVCPRKRVLGR